MAKKITQLLSDCLPFKTMFSIFTNDENEIISDRGREYLSDPVLLAKATDAIKKAKQRGDSDIIVY